MITLRYRIWKMLERCPMSAASVAEALGITGDQARDMMRRLREKGYITYDHPEGREVVYRTTGVVLTADGKVHPKSRQVTLKMGDSRHKRPESPEGYGRGRIALEEHWTGVRE